MQKKLNDSQNSNSKPPIPSSLLSFSRIRKKHNSEGRSVRSTPSLNDVFQGSNSAKGGNSNSGSNMSLHHLDSSHNLSNLSLSNSQHSQHSQMNVNVSNSNQALSKSLMTSPQRQAPPVPTQSHDIYMGDEREIRPQKKGVAAFLDENNNEIHGSNPMNMNMRDDDGPDLDSISVSKSLKVRANERKARSAGYGRTPSSSQTNINGHDRDRDHVGSSSSSNMMNKSMSGTLNLKKSRTRSGHVDHMAVYSTNSETSKRKVLTEIPKYNPEILWEPLPNPDESLKVALANLSTSLETKREVETAMSAGFTTATLRSSNDENNWIITAVALQSVSRLARFHSSTISNSSNNQILSSKLIPLVITFINSIRSKISAPALTAADELTQKFARHFSEMQFDLLMRSLFNVIGGPNNFLREPVEKVLASVIKNNPPVRVINALTSMTKIGKSKTIKEHTAKAFHDLVVFNTPNKMLREYWRGQ